MNKKVIVACMGALALLLLLPLFAGLSRPKDDIKPIERNPAEELRVGMSYEDVAAIMGTPGEELPAAGAEAVSGAWAFAAAYAWPSICGKKLIVVKMKDGAVERIEEKPVENQKTDNKKVATHDQYRQVQIGMTYDQVKEIFGFEGQLAFDLDAGSLVSTGYGDASNRKPAGGIAVSVYYWPAQGGGNYLITFSNEKVSNKAFSIEDDVRGAGAGSMIGLGQGVNMLSNIMGGDGAR